MEYPYDQDTQQKMGIIMTCFLLVLTLIFIVLQLTNFIAWSWWWVLAPFWVPMAIGLVMILLGIKPPGSN